MAYIEIITTGVWLMKSILRTLCITGLLFCSPHIFVAQWSSNPAVNNAISMGTDNKLNPAIASDDSGGAIITWQDRRGGDYDIYAQRISASGTIQWTTNGVPVCTGTGEQTYSAIIGDGNGGAIIAWTDGRNGGEDIYAQRINAAGVPQWTTNGVGVCTAAYDQFRPGIVSDGNGGAIIAWYNHNGSSDWRIAAQQVGAGGGSQWITDGITISSASYNQTSPNIISDGNGGAIFSWWGSTVPINIYVQRINASGAEQWTPGGVATCAATLISGQGIPNLVSDDYGGALMAWTYNTSGNWYGIFAQWITSDGSLSWSSNGVSIFQATHQLSTPKLASDDSGGAIIIWTEYRSSSSYTDVYAQRILADSTLQWPAGGVRLCTFSGDQLYPNVIGDGNGGAIVAWNDYRSGRNVYAQKISAGGMPQWNDYTAAAICTATGDQFFPVLASDNSGGAIVTWFDARNAYYDIYAQRVFDNGSLTSVDETDIAGPNHFSLEQNYPNPFNPGTTIRYTLPARSRVRVEILNVLGQSIARPVDGVESAGKKEIEWNAEDRSSGVYFVRIQATSSENNETMYTTTRKMLLIK
jgi:hypothetical protein